MLHSNTREKIHLPDLLFTPNNLDTIAVLDKKGLEQSYNIGYNYASKMLDGVVGEI